MAREIAASGELGRIIALHARRHASSEFARTHGKFSNLFLSSAVHDIDAIRTVVSAVKKPFNLVMGFADPTLTVERISEAGVKRISVGGAMARYALAAFLKSAHEMKDRGSVTYVREMAPIREVKAAFG